MCVWICNRIIKVCTSYTKYIALIQPYACNGCHDLSMMIYNLDDFMTLDTEGADYRCFVWNMSKSNAINMLKNNSKLDYKDTYEYGF